MLAQRFMLPALLACAVPLAAQTLQSHARADDDTSAPVTSTEASDSPAEVNAEAKPDRQSSAAPVHDRVDRLVEAAQVNFDTLAAPRSSDEEFVRRIYLDLNGVIPSAGQTRQFLDDTSASKREELIDALLVSPQFARHMQYVFDEMLMERLGGANVPAAEWQTFLRESFRANKPWDQLAAEVLSADGADEKKRAAAKFYLDRNFTVDLVTKDVGRVFLGVDLECAQCHDHPNIDDYLQRHYYGLTAFLKRSYIFTDPKSKKKMLGEKAEGDVKFTSVFTQEEGSTNPRLLDLPEIPDPDTEEVAYIAKPDKKTRGIPKYSRREQLAKAMISEENIEFRQNIVNRLWATMLGRGLVEPLDVRHAANPPSHPKVLDLLAQEFHAHGYDVKWLVRELALSRTYQRSSAHKDGSAPSAESADAFACGLLKPLSPEQLAWSGLEATGATAVTMAAQEAALLKKEPEAAPQKKDDPVWREEALRTALNSEITAIVTKFAGQGGQKTSFEATANQALFLINGSQVNNWLTPKGANVAARLLKLHDESAFSEELYVSVLSRRPTASESTAVAEYLNSVSDRATATREMMWALLSSAEFRFNH